MELKRRAMPASRRLTGADGEDGGFFAVVDGAGGAPVPSEKNEQYQPEQQQAAQARVDR